MHKEHYYKLQVHSSQNCIAVLGSSKLSSSGIRTVARERRGHARNSPRSSERGRSVPDSPFRTVVTREPRDARRFELAGKPFRADRFQRLSLRLTERILSFRARILANRAAENRHDSRIPFITARDLQMPFARIDSCPFPRRKEYSSGVERLRFEANCVRVTVKTGSCERTNGDFRKIYLCAYWSNTGPVLKNRR